ncbi:hypothetical protein [Tenacibaculum sp. L6]|uniref:hypothetical protein n=1 Tax=Tenacibaculum sp. L6 TaxID=2992764 RepID=UPI00237BFC4D|nr:hypothetical protein [Tenacibaculum sp. L6]MDE0534845.1 hypothetical protein [Tenacibaculum sp. L6]
MMIRITLLIVLFVICSCKSITQENQLNDTIKLCIDKKSKKYTLETFNIYDYSEKIEQILIDEKFLLTKNKESYNNLLDEIANASREKKYFELYKKINKDLYYSDVLMNPGVMPSVFECIKNSFTSEKLEENQTFNNYIKSIDEILKSALFNNYSLNKRIINTTPEGQTSSIIYRAPMIAIIYSNLYYYNESNGNNSKWLIR